MRRARCLLFCILLSVCMIGCGAEINDNSGSDKEQISINFDDSDEQKNDENDDSVLFESEEDYKNWFNENMIQMFSEIHYVENTDENYEELKLKYNQEESFVMKEDGSSFVGFCYYTYWLEDGTPVTLEEATDLKKISYLDKNNNRYYMAHLSFDSEDESKTIIGVMTEENWNIVMEYNNQDEQVSDTEEQSEDKETPEDKTPAKEKDTGKYGIMIILLIAVIVLFFVVMMLRKRNMSKKINSSTESDAFDDDIVL